MQSFKKKLEVKDLSNIPREDIKEIQRNRDKLAIITFGNALTEGRIDEDEYNYLLEAYQDGMAWCRLVYRSIYETFGSPLCVAGYNPKTGDVDVDEKGLPINYTLKALTPIAPTKLKFVDKKNNAIDAIFPQMKSPQRTIEKLETELQKEYWEEINDAYDHLFVSEDREAFCEQLNDINPSFSRLKDIYRLTFTAKYLSDVKRLKKIFTKFGEKSDNKFYFVKEKETRDRFDKPLSENKKKYYDIKMIMHQKLPNGKDFAVEIQLKIDTLFRADVRTHELYEKAREIESKPVTSSPREAQLNKQLMSYYSERIKQINVNAIHAYNMKVLDKLYRIEDEYVAMEIEPDNKNKTYKKCEDFLENNYMVESYHPFNSQKAFSKDSVLNKMCFLKLIGKVPENFDEFAEKANDLINEKFDALKPDEVIRFEGINNIAEKYQDIISQKISKRKSIDFNLLKPKKTKLINIQKSR